MSRTEIQPIPVHVINHPEPGRYELRSGRRTLVLTAGNPYVQVAGYDPLRESIIIIAKTNDVIVCDSIQQASDPNNTQVPVTTTTSNTPAVANQIPLAATGVAAYSNNPAGVIQTIQGGTVTAIAINGVSTGLTSGSFYVPANGTVTVTYSVAPTTYSTAGIPVSASVTVQYANPNGTYLPAGVRYKTPGQNEIWLVSNVYPTMVGIEIIRKVPEL